ncbi:MAG: flagellar protein FlaG [Tumebacillaceae bacterium]
MGIQEAKFLSYQTDPSKLVAADVGAKTAPVGPDTPQKQEGVDTSLDRLQKQLTLMKETNFQMDYDQEIDRVVIKYTSKSTGEVISQIPSEKFVEIEKAFIKTIGLLFDQKA